MVSIHTGLGNDATDWNEEKNARRAALINKKYDHGLTAGEKKELARLQNEADRFVEQVAPLHTEKIEGLLAELKNKAKDRKRLVTAIRR